MSTAGKGASSSCSVAHKFSRCDALCAAQQRKIKAASATKRVPIASEVPLFLSRAAFQLHYVSFTGCISSTCSLIWAISTCRRCQPETNVGLWRSWESSILRCRLARCRITLREQHTDNTLWYIHHSTRIYRSTRECAKLEPRVPDVTCIKYHFVAVLMNYSRRTKISTTTGLRQIKILNLTRIGSHTRSTIPTHRPVISGCRCMALLFWCAHNAMGTHMILLFFCFSLAGYIFYPSWKNWLDWCVSTTGNPSNRISNTYFKKWSFKLEGTSWEVFCTKERIYLGCSDSHP